MEKDAILKKRVYALTIDLAIIVGTNAFLVASFNHFIRTVFFHLPTKMQLFLIAKTSYMTSVSMLSLTFAYFSLFYFLTNGRTMGKMIFSLKVTNTDDSEMTLPQAMLRATAYLVCAFTGSFLFALSYIRKDQKSLADIFSHMEVVPDKKEKVVMGTEFDLALHRELKAQKTLDHTIDQEDKAA